MALIKKQSLSDQLYEQIRKKIINLTYPMGSKVNVNELQEIYGVSSTPIREAINRLQVEGLITYENNVGAHVVLLKEDDIKEIQSLALVLHSAAVKFSIQNGKKTNMVKQMKEYLNDYYNASNIDDEVTSIYNIMGVFYRNCGNVRLDNNMKVIQGEQLMLRYLYLTKSQNDKSKENYFEKIYNALHEGDSDRIIEILTIQYNEAIPVLVKAVKSFNQTFNS